MEDTEVRGEKVYLVWCDNGEPYEDNMSYPAKIFHSKDAAVKWLDESFDLIKPNIWATRRHRCEITGLTSCGDCDTYKKWVDDGIDVGPEVGDDDVCEFPCSEYENMSDEWCESEYYYIEEMNMTIRYPGSYSVEAVSEFRQELFALEKKYGIFIDATYDEKWDKDDEGRPVLHGGDAHVVLLDAESNEIDRL